MAATCNGFVPTLLAIGLDGGSIGIDEAGRKSENFLRSEARLLMLSAAAGGSWWERGAGEGTDTPPGLNLEV